MKSNLLLNKIYSIQNEYKDLLTALLPKIKSSQCQEALDEINLFWIRYISVVQLYLKALFAGKDSYVFTAATYMDFEDNEHLPFLLIGDKHVLDDPLSRYSETLIKMPDGRDADYLHKQIGITAEDNLKILKNINNNILVLPLRLFNQSNAYTSLFDIGNQTFVSLFNGIESAKDYFKKCSSFEDIMLYAREDIGKLVLFSENDDTSLPFDKRFEVALTENKYMIDTNKTDAYNFYMLVFGCIQQAIDVIVSCVEYECIPYIRYPVSLHYISLLSESMQDIGHITTLRYKMSVSFVVNQLSDKEQLGKVSLDEFLRKKQEYGFNQKLFCTLEQHGINERNFWHHKVHQLVVNELEAFYKQLIG